MHETFEIITNGNCNAFWFVGGWHNPRKRCSPNGFTIKHCNSCAFEFVGGWHNPRNMTCKTAAMTAQQKSGFPGMVMQKRTSTQQKTLNVSNVSDCSSPSRATTEELQRHVMAKLLNGCTKKQKNSEQIEITRKQNHSKCCLRRIRECLKSTRLTR